jgi:hypothetical protein
MGMVMASKMDGRVRHSGRSRAATVALLVMTAGVLTPSHPALANLKELDGYWTGTGTVKLANGQTEAVKCVVTYRVDLAQSGVRQSLRCASAAYKINARADLKIAGSAITGTWEETNYNATGAVTGKLNDSNYTLSIKAPTFTANMKLAAQRCRQAIEIEPQGLDVAGISITLSKC